MAWNSTRLAPARVVVTRTALPIDVCSPRLIAAPACPSRRAAGT
ncbi:hypothetical protein ACFPRL_28530 [Pseudoclavibacter helvolus]